MDENDLEWTFGFGSNMNKTYVETHKRLKVKVKPRIRNLIGQQHFPFDTIFGQKQSLIMKKYSAVM